jgi:hypothetical protein
MRPIVVAFVSASLTISGACLQQVQAKPNSYQVIACQELLKGLLARPATLKIGQIELIQKEEDVNDEGSAIITFTALDKHAKEIESKALCSIEDRASASIMDIQHVDHMRF